MNEELTNFDLPRQEDSIIKVIGVGGGGGNAVNQMFKRGIKDVGFVVCNTDSQALEESEVPIKIQLGESLTEGLGAGSHPSIGEQSAMENLEDIHKILQGKTKMAFVTAGMGGGTGTGAAPVIAQAAKKQGILTVGIVTLPFRFEGNLRLELAKQGIRKLKENVDTLLVIDNEKLIKTDTEARLSQAFSRADDVLAKAAKCIAEIITLHGYVNVDFEDVKTVMKDGGLAVMGLALSKGEGRADKAVREALNSPLLSTHDVKGAKNILLNITFGNKEVTMNELENITQYVQNEVGDCASVIWGVGHDKKLEDEISVTIIATGFDSKEMKQNT